MSRLPRTLPPGYPAHVVHRGNNRNAIFRCEADYLFLHHCLSEARKHSEVEIHSYVFMTNHFHLLLTPRAEDEVSRFIQSAARRYVGYFNARYRRTGTLWEGRFHASVIEGDEHLFRCHTYIDMNPVRAEMVGHPTDYPWSSHGLYSQGKPDSLVEPHPSIVALAADDRARRAAYQRLVDTPLSPDELASIRLSLQRCCRLGGVKEPPRPKGRPPKMRL